jgi:hypothetical protein
VGRSRLAHEQAPVPGVKRNSNAGYTTAAARQVRSINTLMKRGGYVPDPQREARLRRVTRTRNQLIRDLGGDPSKAQMLLAANAAIYAVWLQDNAERMLSGVGVETREYVNVSRACMQTLQALDIQRKPRDVLTLDRYLEKVDDSAGNTPQDPKRS